MNTTMINFNQICDFSYRRKLYSIPAAEYASFLRQARTPKTDLLQFNSFLPKVAII